MAGPCVVLVVDDNPADSQLVQEALEHVGFTGAVVAVETATKAFACLARRPPYGTVPRPSLVLIDVNMPVISGFDVLREMRANPAWASIPVLMFTSSRVPADRVRATELGAQDFVTKPIDWAGYVAVARTVAGLCADAA